MFDISNSLLHFLPRIPSRVLFKCMWHTQEHALARPIMETPELFSIFAPTNSSPRTHYYMYMAHARARTHKLVIHISLSLRVSPSLTHTANRPKLSRSQNHFSKSVLKPLNFPQNLHPRTPSHELIICMRHRQELAPARHSRLVDNRSKFAKVSSARYSIHYIMLQ